MLTPIEIQGKQFKGSGMGYSKADVDSFMGTLMSDYEQLYKDNLLLKEKIAALDESLSHYKEIEKSLQKALVLAETTAEETITSAKKNATVIEQEAVLKAQTIVSEAKVELTRLNGAISDLLQQYESYKTQYKALASAQLDLLASPAFNFAADTAKTLETLRDEAGEGMDVISAEAVHYVGETQEPEEDFDETLSAEEDVIKDISSIFSDEASGEDDQ